MQKNISSIGVVFADLNGLKRINDKEGHAEGDAFIRNFSLLLAKTFGKEFCCRISGDEFLVWQEDMDNQIFENKVNDFRKILKQNGKPMASVGLAWSTDILDMDKLVREAESSMYQEKLTYYHDFPEEQR